MLNAISSIFDTPKKKLTQETLCNMSQVELNDLAVSIAELKSTLVQRLDDVVRRIDGFERRLDKHQDQIADLKNELTLWKGGLLLLSVIFPLALRFWPT